MSIITTGSARHYSKTLRCQPPFGLRQQDAGILIRRIDAKRLLEAISPQFLSLW